MQGETARDERDGALGGVGSGALRCIPNLGCGSSCARSVGPLRFSHRNLPASKPCESPWSMYHAWTCGCGGYTNDIAPGYYVKIDSKETKKYGVMFVYRPFKSVDGEP